MVRTATIADIPALHRIRMSVKENVLSNPLLISESSYNEFLETRGKGWLFEEEGKVFGFAIIDIKRKNIWALFVDPYKEKNGIGKKLQTEMLNWYFSNYSASLWLTTAAGTRAETFYRKSGWKQTGIDSQGEIIFEMDAISWQNYG
jgi:N-acetylglutamate synthase-like GNAT family acetyltransferase